MAHMDAVTQPILQQLRAWIDGGGDPRNPPRVDEDSNRLGKIKFAAGAMDGIALHHFQSTDERTQTDTLSLILGALLRLKRDRSDAARAELYDACMQGIDPATMDLLLERLRGQTTLGPRDVAESARWLTQNARHLGPLKTGMALVGACGDESDLADLKILARHDDFTLYAAVAAASLAADPLGVLWEMARGVHGWGKIHLVERLTDLDERPPGFREWLLREGCANNVMDEYLAYRCAVHGELLAAISADTVDDPLLDGACTIIGALLRGGPAESIDDYQDGAAVVECLLELLQTRCNSLPRLGFVVDVHSWLEWPTPREHPEYFRQVYPDFAEIPRVDFWPERATRGWTAERRAHLSQRCKAILCTPAWAARVREEFASSDFATRWFAQHVSKAVGVDLWEDEFARLQVNPLEDVAYDNLLRTDDLTRVRRLLEFAEMNLPLEQIATGPEDALGLGPGFEPHHCLDSVLPHLRRAGVYSEKLVAAAFRSPCIRNRNQAMDAVEGRPVEEWGPAVIQAAQQTLRDEPDEELRARLQELCRRLPTRES